MTENVDDQGSTQPSSNNHDDPELWPKPLKMTVLANICFKIFNDNFHAVDFVSDTTFPYAFANLVSAFTNAPPISHPNVHRPTQASIATSFSLLVVEFRVGYPSIAPLVPYPVLMIGLGCLL